MRALLALLLILRTSAAAAQPPAWAPGMPWAPAAPYVTVGQDEPGYRNWYMASPSHAAAVRSVQRLSDGLGVGGVVPTWHSSPQASGSNVGRVPFEVPPTEAWRTWSRAWLRPRKVIPEVGPVNRCRSTAIPSSTCAPEVRRKARIASCRRWTWCRFVRSRGTR